MSTDLVQEIQNKIDIVELVAETTELERRGNRYWGLCPFHSEKTPSFSVSADRQLFYCFGCHLGGNIFTFVMERENVEFREALEILAARAGLDSSLYSGRYGRKREELQKVSRINEAAAEFYHQRLLAAEGQQALAYLENRGVSADAMARFELGYAPDDWRKLLNLLLRRGYSTEDLLASGVVKRSRNQDTYFDLFRHRVIFPIRNISGQVVGMGGRSLDEVNLPKYLNTPETRVFSKRNQLYGLFQARDAVRRLNQVILVEGYLDCIKLHQYGIENTVASLGTAFTSEQARLLKRYAEKVIIIFDGDEAGQRETERALDVMKEAGLEAAVVTLPGSQDPDEYIELLGKEEFLTYIKNYKMNPLAFKLERRLKGAGKLTLKEKLAILQEFYPELGQINSQIEFDSYLVMMGRKLELQERAIYQDYRTWQNHSGTIGINRNRNSGFRNNKEGNENHKNLSFQERLLARMINDRDIFQYVQQTIGIAFFSDLGFCRIAELCSDGLEEGGEGSGTILGQLAWEEPELEAACARLSQLEEESYPSNKDVEEFVEKVKMLVRKKKRNKMLNDIRSLKDKGDFYDFLSIILRADSHLKIEEGGK